MNSGFTRIIDGSNPLDTTAVHPESYEAAKKLLAELHFEPQDITTGSLKNISKKISDYKKLAEELGIGEITLRDIVKELEKPARDPRDDMPKPILRSDVLEMKDLTEGMILKGTVRNVIDFGVFVDIGVSGRTGAYFPDLRPFYQASARSSQRRRYRRRQGAERRPAEKTHSVDNERRIGRKYKKTRYSAAEVSGFLFIIL